ncbi:MAG: hypothetical protein V4684_07405 [Pseudomonadota bacterium]
MEIEIELNVTLAVSHAQKLRESLSGKFELIAFKGSNKFSLRPIGAADSGLTIDRTIQNYLGAMEPFGRLLEQANGVMRVGAFFPEGEPAAFSVLLSNTTVQMLARRQFTIDVTCYPCS